MKPNPPVMRAVRKGAAVIGSAERERFARRAAFSDDMINREAMERPRSDFKAWAAFVHRRSLTALVDFGLLFAVRVLDGFAPGDYVYWNDRGLKTPIGSPRPGTVIVRVRDPMDLDRAEAGALFRLLPASAPRDGGRESR
jgi:hypothetical protein